MRVIGRHLPICDRPQTGRKPRRGRAGSGGGGLPAPAALAAALHLVEPAPDAIALPGVERELEARLPHGAAGAHGEGARGLGGVVGEEDRRVLVATARVSPPLEMLGTHSPKCSPGKLLSNRPT